MAKEKEVKKDDFEPKDWASYRKNKDGTFTGLVPKTKMAITRVGLTPAQIKKIQTDKDAKNLADAQKLVDENAKKEGVK